MVQDILLRTLMMGGIDGIITMFNMISVVEGSKLNYKYIFILGFATLISDAISMGSGEYFSVKAEKDYNKNKGIIPNPINDTPYKNGLVMFISFIGFGIIPLIIYYIAVKINYKNKYINTYISIFIALFILGIIKSTYTSEKWYISGGGTAIYGSSAALIAFYVSKFINILVL